MSVHYRDLEHAYVYWIWLHGYASYVIIFIDQLIVRAFIDVSFNYNLYTAILRKVVGKKHQSAHDKTERWSGYSLEFYI